MPKLEQIKMKLREWRSKAAYHSLRFLNFSIYVLTTPWRVFRVLCFVVGIVTLVIAGGLSAYTYNFLDSLPDFQATSFASLKKIALTKNKSRLENKSKLYRWVKLRDISRDYLYAIVMSEDSTFFEHEGIDYDALVDSLAMNLRKREIMAGGSTITQQTVKNLFLSNERSIIRKVKEVLITQDLETYLSKNQILELYLNMAEFGPDIYGVFAASRAYFNKKPSEIIAPEAAFIALMLPSPRRNHYSIFENKNLTKSKRRKIRRILSDMLHNEFISAKQYYSYIKYDFFTAHPSRTIASEKPKRSKKR